MINYKKYQGLGRPRTTDYYNLKWVLVLFITLILILVCWLAYPQEELISPLSDSTFYIHYVGEARASEKPSDIYTITKMYADFYGVDENLALCVLEKESNGNIHAVGDNGASVGAWQFKLRTWQSFRKQMGEDIKDMRECRLESTRTAMWGISKGYGPHWTGWRICKKLILEVK